MKKALTIFSAALLLLLCSCASSKPADPILSRTWNDMELTRTIPTHNRADIEAVNSVLTVGENTLELHFKRGLENQLKFGPEWFVQVKIDGLWFNIPNDIQMDSALSVENSSKAKEKLTFDLSGLNLPAGEYRFALKYSEERLLDTGYISAPFWVINPGDEIPSASLTSGEADPADIIVSVSSRFPARPMITDADAMIVLHIENLSGKDYTHSRLKLEKLGGSEPETIKYEHANMGMVRPWAQDSSEIFLNEPLAPGKYRLTPSLYSGSIPFITPEIEFYVIAESRAPRPIWDNAEWLPSTHVASSERIRITLGDTSLGGDKTELQISLDCDIDYQYGEFFMLEANIGGQWFTVPTAHGIGYLAIAHSTSARSDFALNLTYTHGILPTGQYRLVMEFQEVSYSEGAGTSKYLSREIAFTEFEVTEPIISNPFANSFK